MATTTTTTTTALPKSGVLVPLYIYPLTPTTWDPLYDA